MSTSKSKPTGNRRRNRKRYGEGKEFPVKKPKQSSPVKKMKDEVKVIKEVETKKANHLLKVVGGMELILEAASRTLQPQSRNSLLWRGRILHWT
jgi:hypothetical protein